MIKRLQWGTSAILGEAGHTQLKILVSDLSFLWIKTMCEKSIDSFTNDQRILLVFGEDNFGYITWVFVY